VLSISNALSSSADNPEHPPTRMLARRLCTARADVIFRSASRGRRRVLASCVSALETLEPVGSRSPLLGPAVRSHSPPKAACLRVASQLREREITRNQCSRPHRSAEAQKPVRKTSLAFQPASNYAPSVSSFPEFQAQPGRRGRGRRGGDTKLMRASHDTIVFQCRSDSAGLSLSLSDLRCCC